MVDPIHHTLKISSICTMVHLNTGNPSKQLAHTGLSALQESSPKVDCITNTDLIFSFIAHPNVETHFVYAVTLLKLGVSWKPATPNQQHQTSNTRNPSATAAYRERKI